MRQLRLSHVRKAALGLSITNVHTLADSADGKPLGHKREGLCPMMRALRSVRSAWPARQAATPV